MNQGSRPMSVRECRHGSGKDRVASVRLLLIEDSPTDAALTVTALRRAGHQVESLRVETEAELRAALTTGTWDVVTCDWAMPCFSAPEALAVLAELDLDLPFIIVSGTVGEELAVDMMRAGAHDYVLKDRIARLAPAVEREIHNARDRARQRRAASEQVATEARYRRIVENTNQGVWMIDAQSKTTFLNERMAQLLGVPVADVMGRSPADFLGAESRAGFADAVARHRVGESYQHEVRFVRADGSSLWALVETSPLTDAQGQHAGSFAMVMDVTARKQAEASLRISEERFRSLWESGIILITISDLHGRIVDVNEGFGRALGYTREELLSGDVRWSDLTPASWTDADRIAVGQLAKHGVSTPWEKELIAKDGTRVPILAGAVMLASEGITIAIDLSERKRVDKALYERMKTAALTVDVGIALTARTTLPEMLQECSEAIVRHLDAAFARIWTRDPSTNMLELQASAGTHKQPSGQTRIRVGELEVGKSYAMIVGGELVGAIEMFSRDGLTEVVAGAMRAVADAIAVGIRRERAEQAKETLEAQLRQAQKLEAIGSLAGGVAHDFNNILSVILTYCEFIQSDLEPGHAVLGDVAEIHDAATRATGLTRQLLAFSRQQVLQPRVLDLNAVIHDLDSLLRRMLPEDLELVVRLDPTIGNIHADPGQIEQVLMNLVVNARDAMQDGGTVAIETAKVELDAAFVAGHIGVSPGPHTLLRVTDSGAGMTAEVRARIFEPFFTTKAMGKGTGLGLSTVFGIVRQSGGMIWVDSTPGAGTRFEIYLPVSTSPRTHVETPSTAVRRGCETVLLCEDEAPVRVLAREILLRQGYRVIEAKDGPEALQLGAQLADVDLLLTDVVMPKLSGRQLAEQLRRIRPTLKVLYMSGYTDDAIVRHGVLIDELEFLAKPLTPESLSRKVRAVLDTRVVLSGNP
jgi:two-component system cell cycle sensor histidine kinase/response regulator CckA